MYLEFSPLGLNIKVGYIQPEVYLVRTVFQNSHALGLDLFLLTQKLLDNFLVPPLRTIGFSWRSGRDIAKYKLPKDLVVAKAETRKLLLRKNRCMMVVILDTFFYLMTFFFFLTERETRGTGNLLKNVKRKWQLVSFWL